MIKLTNLRKHGEVDAVYVNPAYIIRVSAAMNASRDTVVEVDGSQYATWCSESVDEVISLIEAHKEAVVALEEPKPYKGKVTKP